MVNVHVGMAAVERVLYINSLENLKYYRNDFDRLYFGQEFCERLIPSPDQVREALLFARNKNLSFSFMTPYVTDRGLDLLVENLLFLEKTWPESEVIFNDWGVFRLLYERFSVFTPVLGRLLNKLKRGPRIMNIFEKIPSSSKRYLRGSGFDTPWMTDFLINNNVHRVEFDNVLQGTDFKGMDRRISISVYIPFVFVSTTRYCFAMTPNHNEDRDDNFFVGVFDCSHDCRGYNFRIDNPVMGRPLFRKLNAGQL